MPGRYRVLVVDDSAALLAIVGAYLRETSFEVVDTARDGVTAVQKFVELQPDVVLLDVVMPRQGGPEALRQILTVNPAAVVGMVSSFGTEEIVQDCMRLGARGFLDKPFTREDLIAFLERISSVR